MFYEANEPSSACRLWRIFMVETSTPPSKRNTLSIMLNSVRVKVPVSLRTRAADYDA